ncbi:MAG: asparagine synthase (glutamine-hydrolyzing) [Saprospiraceae bacterium]|nr:asparagine synthase (glutamine-hydrolyzing) [Saprospiraceae bacterium]
MCGIFGAIGKKCNVSPEAVFQLLKHRGPDDRGFYKDEQLLLAHVRLSIVDLSSGGHQPMFSADGNFVLVFNGEIYNYLELKKELERDFTFNTESDTEVLLCALIKWGMACLNKLNGIFSFAFYNIAEKRLWLCRDQFGVKPLYYFHDDTGFYFASEIKAITAFVHPVGINTEGLYNYLYFMYSPGETAFLDNLYKLPGGHFLEFDLSINQHKVIKYFQLPLAQNVVKLTALEESMRLLESILLKNIELQLNADVPVGFMLSGGLDSSLILAMAKKIQPNTDFTAYTIAASTNFLNEGFSDDVHFAKLVCRHLGVRHKIIENDNFEMEDIDQLIYHLEEPQADISSFLVGRIAQQARQDGVFVLMSGAGGDDFFSGYRRHQAIYYQKTLGWWPGSFVMLKYISACLGKNSSINRRLNKFLKSFSSDGRQLNLASLYGWIDFDQLKSLLNDALILDQWIDHPIRLYETEFQNLPAENTLNKLLYLDSKYFLPDHNLNYNDKLSMAHGVELRVPLVNMDLANFTANLSVEFKMKAGETKFILKKLAEKYLPEKVVYRSKTGFGGPVRSWFDKPNGEKFLDLLDSNKHYFNKIFNVEKLRNLYDLNLKGEVDASYTLLGVLFVESCLRQFYFNAGELKINS